MMVLFMVVIMVVIFMVIMAFGDVRLSSMPSSP